MNDPSTLDTRKNEQQLRPAGAILIPKANEKPTTPEPPRPQFRRGTIILGG